MRKTLAKTGVYFISNCDTLLSNILNPYGESVAAKSESGEHLSTTCSEGVINRCPNEKITYFFIDANIKNNTLWDTIRFKNKYLRRETLSVADLNARNWTITYP